MDETKTLDLGEYFETALLVRRDGQLALINAHPNVLIILHDYDNIDPNNIETDIIRGERYSLRYSGRPEALEKLNILLENLRNEKNTQIDELNGSGDSENSDK
jgi:hypothetical protein